MRTNALPSSTRSKFHQQFSTSLKHPACCNWEDISANGQSLRLGCHKCNAERTVTVQLVLLSFYIQFWNLKKV